MTKHFELSSWFRGHCKIFKQINILSIVSAILYDEKKVKMIFVHRIVGMVGIIILAFAFFEIIKASQSQDQWDQLIVFVGMIRPSHIICYGIGGFFYLGIYVLTAIPFRRKRKLLSFDNEGGTVSISTDAICDYIGKLASEFPSIIRLNPEVIATRNSIDLIVGVRIKAGLHIHEVCKLLQSRIRESVTNGLGISQIRRVEVSVFDIVSEHNPT